MVAAQAIHRGEVLLINLNPTKGSEIRKTDLAWSFHLMR